MVSLRPAAVDAVEQLLEGRHPQLDLPGVSLAVTDADGPLLARGHGLADVAANVPVRDDTRFEIGSISKSFTALALGADALAGRVDLDAPLTHHLPWFSVAATHPDPITPRHLLGHGAGIVQGDDASNEARTEVWALRDTPAIARPGTWFHYSNVGYKALGLLLEALHDRPFHEVLDERILRPLGLDDTHAVTVHALRPRLAVGYEPLLDDRPFAPGGRLTPATWLECGTADGSIAATACDLAAYLRALLAPRDPDGPVTTSLRALVTRPGLRTEDPVPGAAYGCGWDVFTLDGRRCIAHGGGMVGYRAHAIADLDAGLGVVVLGNGPGDPSTLAREVLAIACADRAGAAPPRPSQDASDPARVPDAAALAGVYRGAEREIALLTAGDRLSTADGSTLVRAGTDRFHVVGDEPARFVLGVERDPDGVAALTFGPERLWRVDREPRRREPRGELPDPSLAGHWRSYNPWLTNFRTFIRDGELILAAPVGTEAPGEEQALIALDDDAYRRGADPRLPERLRFSVEVDGEPQQASLDACAYARTFTP